MNIHTIGIDLGKTRFHLVGLNERGEVVVRKQLSRAQLRVRRNTGVGPFSDRIAMVAIASSFLRPDFAPWPHI